PASVFHLGIGSPAALGPGDAAKADLFFHFLIGLPEKKVRRDRGTEDGHQRRQERRIETELGQKSRLDDFEPIGPGKERRTNIRKEDQRQPYEGAGKQTVGRPEWQRKNDEGYRQDEQVDGNGHQQIERRGDGSKVCARVDSIRYHEQKNREIQKIPGI